jgi:hypothetical protein
VVAAPVDLHVAIPHIARMYDDYLGGKTNYPADREAAEQALSAFPNGRVAAQQNRAFPHRAVRYLASQAGIDVPRHRRRHSDLAESARGRSGGRTFSPCRVRRQRPFQVGLYTRSITLKRADWERAVRIRSQMIAEIR